jgi:biopolymer transport protein ExbD
MGDHQVAHYQGSLDQAIQQHQVGNTGFTGEGGIRDLILAKKVALRQRGQEKDFMVIINPDASCSYQTLVDLFDELQINNVKRYSLVNNEADIKAVKQALD